MYVKNIQARIKKKYNGSSAIAIAGKGPYLALLPLQTILISEKND